MKISTREEIINTIINFENIIISKMNIEEPTVKINENPWTPKYCRFCKSPTHNSHECRKHKIMTKNNNNKTLLINEEKEKVSEIKIRGQILDKEKIDVIIDTGSKENYISEIYAQEINAPRVKIDQYKTTFGNGEEKFISEKMKICINLPDYETKVEEELYILEGLPDYLC